MKSPYPLIEGPLGFPMPDKAARAVDALLKTLPKTKDYEYRKTLVSRPPTELNPRRTAPTCRGSARRAWTAWAKSSSPGA